MSIVGNLKQITKEELDRILTKSKVLEEMLDSENDNDLDIDKAWEGIYFLFNGYGLADIDKTTEPFNLIFYGGQIVDEEQDLGYGPAYYITPEQVQKISQSLKEVSDEEIQKRYNPEKMMQLGLYPEVWTEQPKEGLELLMESIQDLRKFYERAATEGKAVVTYLS